MSKSKPTIDLMTLTMRASGAVTAHRAVGPTGAQATVKGQKVRGIASADAASGTDFPVKRAGTEIIETGAAIALTDEIITDTQGRAIPARPAVSVTVTAVTKASPGVVTAAGHGLQTGDVVTFNGVGGMVELNSKTFTATRVDANSFSIGVDSSGFTTFTAGGTVTKVSADNVFAEPLEAAAGEGEFIEVLLK